MGKNLISIALCTYNGEKHLVEQMDSLLQQDYQHLEIVIVDDCSTDRTFEILTEYQQRYPQIRLYKNKENLGFNKNFEAALLQCKGSYIAIADQDDIWEVNKISSLHAKINGNLLIYHDSLLINDTGAATGKRISDMHRFIKGQCEQYLLYNNCVSGHACLISKDLLPHIFPFPTDMYYDWWMAYTAAGLGKINYLLEPLVKHRKHATSSTTRDKINDKELRIRSLTLFKNHPENRMETVALIDQLQSGYEDLQINAFSFKLFFTLLKKSKILFHVRRRSLFSKIKFIIKESIR